MHNHKINIRNESHSSAVPIRAGENNKSAKYKEKTIKAIIQEIETTETSLVQIAKKFNVSEDLVYDISRCRTWKYLHNYKKNIRKESKGR